MYSNEVRIRRRAVADGWVSHLRLLFLLPCEIKSVVSFIHDRATTFNRVIMSVTVTTLRKYSF